ncbi:hypothetical protein FS749_008353 [Ceratobasidium sp. UAMH 11750]|nr:hypothetical protein FS749_008353 [Ceratobasidium sp. UAMH 11750]
MPMHGHAMSCYLSSMATPVTTLSPIHPVIIRHRCEVHNHARFGKTISFPDFRHDVACRQPRLDMNRDPIRLTYMILDGRRKGAFGRVKIPYERDYHNLIGLDLLDLLKEQISWDRRSQTVILYKSELAEHEAHKLLDEYAECDYDEYIGKPLPFSSMRLLAQLNSYWTYSPPSDQVHLLVEIKSWHKCIAPIEQIITRTLYPFQEVSTRRLTYMILDGNKTGVFGRLKVPVKQDYNELLMGLDLLEPLGEKIKWDCRSKTVKLYQAKMNPFEAELLLHEGEYPDTDIYNHFPGCLAAERIRHARIGCICWLRFRLVGRLPCCMVLVA